MHASLRFVLLVALAVLWAAAGLIGAELETVPPAGQAIEVATAVPAEDERFGHLALGAGFPDLRARLSLGHGMVSEVKVALEPGIQVYSTRLGWNFWMVGPVKMTVLGEAGLAQLSEVDGVSGQGSILGVAAGAEYPFNRSFRAAIDVGPMWVQARSSLAEASAVDVIFNAALYFYLF